MSVRKRKKARGQAYKKPKKWKVRQNTSIHPGKSGSNMITIKTTLKNVVRNQAVLDSIEDMVLRMNRINIHTYQFLKLYTLFQYDSGIEKTIDKTFVMNVMRTVAKPGRNVKGGMKPDTLKMMNDLELFYDSFYAPLTHSYGQKTTYTGLTNMFDYEADSIITAYENFIQAEFKTNLNRYVNIVLDKNDLLIKAREDPANLTKREKEINSEIRKEINLVKTDILFGEKKADPKYDFVKERFRLSVLKDFSCEKSLAYAIKADPMSLHPLLVRMSIDGERIMGKRTASAIDERDKNFHIINAFPLRKSVAPKYVRIDGKLAMYNLATCDTAFYKNRITSDADDIWSWNFLTDKRQFRKNGYHFGHIIHTDGIGCSIQMVKDSYVKKRKYDSKDRDKTDNPPIKTEKIGSDKRFEHDTYVNDLSAHQRKRLENMILVGVDPGTTDLIFATDGHVDTIEKNDKTYREARTFTYTNARRNVESKSKFFNERANIAKKKYTIGGFTVQEHESTLCGHNSNSCIFSNFQEYVRQKNVTNYYVSKFYEQKYIRDFRRRTEINVRRSEDKMVERFIDTFGDPSKVAVIFGDWNNNSVMKGVKSFIRGKRMRRIFARHGFPVFLVNEAYTSCKHYQTGKDLVNIRRDPKRENRRPHRLLGELKFQKYFDADKGSESPYVESLLAKQEYPVIMNRDLNGSLNILYKGRCIIQGNDIPWYLKRPTNVKVRKMSRKDQSIFDKKISMRKTEALDIPSSVADESSIDATDDYNDLDRQLEEAVKEIEEEMKRNKRPRKMSRARAVARPKKVQS